MSTPVTGVPPAAVLPGGRGTDRTGPGLSAAAGGGVAVGTGGTVRGADARTAWHRLRLPLAVALVVLALVLLIGAVGTRGETGRLDPRATDGTGGGALASLLADRGVRVARNTSVAGALDATTPRTVVLVVLPGRLPAEALRRVGGLTDQQAARVVLVAPGSELGAVTDAVHPAGAVPAERRSPGCAEPAALSAGDVVTGGNGYRVDGGSTGCYLSGADATLASTRTRGGAPLVVLGDGTPWTNAHLGEEGHAALGLNLLGADGSADEVRWLVPAPGSAVAETGQISLSDITPSWAVPAAVQLLLAAVLAALWRGRRLGPPVAEPLPVVVRAAETVEGQARLYRRAQAREQAAAGLRAGALARVVPRLGLGRAAAGEPEPAAVVDAVARRTGLPAATARELLYGPSPADDGGLVRLADALDSAVRTTLHPEVPRS